MNFSREDLKSVGLIPFIVATLLSLGAAAAAYAGLGPDVDPIYALAVAVSAFATGFGRYFETQRVRPVVETPVEVAVAPVTEVVETPKVPEMAKPRAKRRPKPKP